MRDSVVIDGVTLTRQQIERAHAKLNAKPEFEAGDVVVFCGDKRGGFCFVTTGFGDWINSDGGRAQAWFERGLHKRIGSLREIVAFYRQHHPEAKR